MLKNCIKIVLKFVKKIPRKSLVIKFSRWRDFLNKNYELTLKLYTKCRNTNVNPTLRSEISVPVRLLNWGENSSQYVLIGVSTLIKIRWICYICSAAWRHLDWRNLTKIYQKWQKMTKMTNNDTKLIKSWLKID